MKTREKYHAIDDPGHGWIAVPCTELNELGIIDQITGYSYLSSKRTIAYLEEDCDVTTWSKAWEKHGVSWAALKSLIKSTYYPNAPCRNFQSYTPELAKSGIKNRNRRLKHQVYIDLGMKRVTGALGGVYCE